MAALVRVQIKRWQRCCSIAIEMYLASITGTSEAGMNTAMFLHNRRDLPENRKQKQMFQLPTLINHFPTRSRYSRAAFLSHNDGEQI